MILEQEIFAKPEDLIAWLKSKEDKIQMNVLEATLLLDYMEGHDYALGINDCNELIRKDIVVTDGEIELYSIDEVIDCVCDWNYELKLDADVRRSNPDNFIHFVNEQNRYEKLIKDEAILDGLFNQTKYKVQCVNLGKQLADEFIINISKNSQTSSGLKTEGEFKPFCSNNRSR